MPGNPDQPRDSKGRWTKTAGGTVGALVAGLMVASSGGGTTASVSTSLETSVAQRATQARTMKSSKNTARKGDERGALNRMGLRKLRQDVSRDLPCVAQSYGEVQQYFLRHPCKRLQQRLFPVADAEGNVIAVSLMWVRMPSRSGASGLKRVEDEYGTGDVIPIGTQLLGFGDVRFTGKHYDSTRKGATLTIAETEPVRGNPPDAFLESVASVVVELPPP